MAEAVALVGVAASVLQLADVGLRITTSGTRLIKKYRDAPHIVSRTVDEVGRLHRILDVLEEPTYDPIKSLLDEVLKACLKDAMSLEEILNRLLVKADDQARSQFKKKLLSTIEDSKIDALRASLERHISQILLLMNQETNGSLVRIETQIVSVHGEAQRLLQTTQKRIEERHAQMLARMHNHDQKVLRVYDEVKNTFSDLDNLRSVPAILHHQREEMREMKELFAQVLNRPSRLSQEYDRVVKMKSTRSRPRHQAPKEHALTPDTEACTSTYTPTTVLRQEQGATPSSSPSWLFQYNTYGHAISASCRISTSCICRTSFCRTCRRSIQASLRFRSRVLNAALALSFLATTGAGGMSISPRLDFISMWPDFHNHPVSRIIRGTLGVATRQSYNLAMSDRLLKSARISIMKSFEAGESSPHDQDEDGANIILLPALEVGDDPTSEQVLLAGKLLVLLRDMGASGRIDESSVRLHSLVEKPTADMCDAVIFFSVMWTILKI